MVVETTFSRTSGLRMFCAVFIILIFLISIAFSFSRRAPRRLVPIRFPGQVVGRVEGAALVATDDRDHPGILGYWPSGTLPPGVYDIEMSYSSSPDVNGSWEEMDYGTHLIEKGRLPASAAGAIHKELSVSESDDGKQMGYYVRYAGAGTLKVNALSIRRRMSLSKIVSDGFLAGLLISAIFLVGVRFRAGISVLGKLPKTRCIPAIVIMGMGTAIVFCVIMKKIFDMDYPYDTFLVYPATRFSDFFNNYELLKPENLFNNAHFPFSLFIEYMFTKLPRHISFVLFVSIFMLFFIWNTMLYIYDKNKSVVENLSVFFVLTFTYPFLFAIDRGNFELYIYIFISCFIYFLYVKPNMVGAILSISFAITMKLFPAVLLLLFLKERKYKECCLVIFCCVAITLLVLLILGGSFYGNIYNFMDSIKQYSALYVVGNQGFAPGLAFGHSLYGIIRLFFQYVFTSFYFDHIAYINRIYMLFTLIYIMFIAWCVLMYKLPLWKQVALLVMSFDILPYTSADYKLLHIYIPVLLFLKCEDKTPADTVSAFLFGLLLIPKSYYIFPGVVCDVGYAASISIIINPLIMLFFTGYIIYSAPKPFPVLHYSKYFAKRFLYGLSTGSLWLKTKH